VTQQSVHIKVLFKKFVQPSGEAAGIESDSTKMNRVSKKKGCQEVKERKGYDGRSWCYRKLLRDRMMPVLLSE
jgi:hypothetical protein